jgi:hypothetical protein
MVLMAIHVDDCYVVGKTELIKQMVNDIENESPKLKVEFDTKEYLSCEILFDTSKVYRWGQSSSNQGNEMSLELLLMIQTVYVLKIHPFKDRTKQ